MFSQKEDELEGWMKTAEALHIVVERDFYPASLKNDLTGVLKLLDVLLSTETGPVEKCQILERRFLD